MYNSLTQSPLLDFVGPSPKIKKRTFRKPAVLLSSGKEASNLQAVGLRPLGLWVRIPPMYECLSLESVVCCQVVSASDRSLVQRSPTECGVPECDREASIMRWLWRTRGSAAREKNSIWDLEL